METARPIALRRTKLVLALGLSLIAVVLLVRNGTELARELEAGGPGSVALGAEVAAGVAAAKADRESPALPADVRVRLEPVAGGFRHPLLVTHAGDGSGRLFVVEQGGEIRIVRGGKVLEVPFLDIAGRLDESSGERGLLGLAFAPDYATSRRFYVAYTARGESGPVVRIVRFLAGAHPDRADPASESVVLEMSDPAGNHNGGGIVFGPDGRLWAGTGDGGSGGDPWDNARNPQSPLGKMLRLDLRGSPELPLPPARIEIWGLGLRNPWRFSFDRATGELWIGDVGQNAWEEVDVVDSVRPAPVHFGWKTMEGFHCYDPRRGCDSAGLELPVHEYGHDRGCSVTGGHVYRGRALPALVGRYLFSDYCTGLLWALERDASGKPTVRTLLRSGVRVSSFGEDAEGEIYLCDHGEGRILKLVP
jgi:glucose/arabinose dehydrogenase